MNVASQPNSIQVSLMRLFAHPMKDVELNKVHTLLTNYYSELIGNEADELMSEKNYTQADLDRVLNQGRQ